MTWVSWRLQRSETLLAVAIVALFAALLIPTGITMANAYHNDGLGSCLGSNPGVACGMKIGAFEQRFQSLTQLANWFTLVPGVIGVMLAAPFILDLEHGTYRLAWSQSITRGRWLLGKLATPIVAAVLAAAALALLVTWWRTPDVNINGRLQTGSFDTDGTVVLGYTLFALGLALAVGAVWRRSAVAIGVAFAGYFVARVFGDIWLRPRLLSPDTATYTGTRQPAFLQHAHVISEWAYIHGHRITTGSFLGGRVQVAEPGNQSHTVWHVVYQPSSQFWPLQLAETGVFTGAAALLVGFAAWWVHERIT
jgi:hypothetical protein